MLGRDLVRPLEDDWRDALDGVARARGWPTSRDVAALAARVAALSEAYNDPERARAAVRDAGPARLGFSFPRDVPKAAAAVRELVATGAVPRAASLRVLDVGAGLGATTWGVARALEAAGSDADLDVTWVDADAPALELAAAIARARQGVGRVNVRTRAIVRSAGALDDLGRFDLVLAGQLLSELDVGVTDELRAARHAELLGSWLERRLEPHGTLVVVEPALRDRTRHLHRVRDRLAAGGATIFAPCLHGVPCPALVRDTDWCHEDLDVDLPAWLAPVARAAGLRREGLTFSYLVLRGDGRRLVDALPGAGRPGVARLRIVSGAIVTKGKREAYVCGELVHGAAREGEEGLEVARARVMRLDRNASKANEAWSRIARGDVVTVDPSPGAGSRVGAETQVSLSGDGESR
jgi:ribosomal protein RSM22 (predicted rRNA methylase)